MSKKVLLVEDSPTEANVIKDLLESQGLWVSLAMSGKEGIEKAKSENPDLIIMDIMMPELDGITAITKIKANQDLKDIPVIICTAVRNDEDEIIETVTRFMAEQALIYCDNGNKVGEFSTYAPLLKHGDIIMAHDYGVEFRLEDLEPVIVTSGIIPFEQALLDELQTTIVAFEKI